MKKDKECSSEESMFGGGWVILPQMYKQPALDFAKWLFDNYYIIGSGSDLWSNKEFPYMHITIGKAFDLWIKSRTDDAFKGR